MHALRMDLKMPEATLQPDLRLEFRIPISPTPGFFAQVQLFHFALQRLSRRYAAARLRVIVGDNCDLGAVRRANLWAHDKNVVWERVPTGLFDVAGMWGTANWRFSLDAGDADVIILSDADTVLLRDIDPILDELRTDRPVVQGHVAHYPPPVDMPEPGPAGPDYWPKLLAAYGCSSELSWTRYSMDMDGTLPLTPPYYNLGFVAMNAAALNVFGQDIHWTEEWLRRFHPSHMRCQIALTLIAAARGIDARCLSAPYNAANDPQHFAASGMVPADVRVLHYLREDEFTRATFLLEEKVDEFLAIETGTIMNAELQELVRQWRATR